MLANGAYHGYAVFTVHYCLLNFLITALIIFAFMSIFNVGIYKKHIKRLECIFIQNYCNFVVRSVPFELVSVKFNRELVVIDIYYTCLLRKSGTHLQKNSSLTNFLNAEV